MTANSGSSENFAGNCVPGTFTNILLWMMLVSAFLSGCQRTAITKEKVSQEQVAYDQKSKQAYRVDASIALPVANPENSTSNLQPAWYCATCACWYPIPPVEVLNHARGAGQCPKHQTPLTPDGPLPEQRLHFDKVSTR